MDWTPVWGSVAKWDKVAYHLGHVNISAYGPLLDYRPVAALCILGESTMERAVEGIAPGLGIAAAGLIMHLLSLSGGVSFVVMVLVAIIVFALVTYGVRWVIAEYTDWI